MSFLFIFCNIKRTINENIGENTTTENLNNDGHKINNCPYSKTIDDVFKVSNKTTENGIYLEDNERANIFLNNMSNVTTNSDNLNTNRSLQDDLVNKIIASINRIKNNITTGKNNTDTLQFNQAIILQKHTDVKLKNNTVNTQKTTFEPTKSNSNKNTYNNASKLILSVDENNRKDIDNKIAEKDDLSQTEKLKTYVEILTIEPNNTSSINTSSHNIIEVLKYLMPMFNSTISKELHNITIIERNYDRNNSFSAMKNISTIVVTYCDNENVTKSNGTYENETILKEPQNELVPNEYLDVDGPEEPDLTDIDDITEATLTTDEKKDIMEAAEYGMQKMHELYSIMEPKLYSMGLWLDDTNPAKYVAAFNAPTEEVARFSRYGYASLQAAARLRQLTGGGGDDGLQGRTEESQFPSASALRQSPLHEHCPLRGAPKCPPASKRYRTHDGTCNNLNRPRWGSTMTPVQRFLPPSYSDGLQAPRRSIFGSKLPSAREISSLIHESKDVETDTITHLLMQWGQFIDHDITSSSQSRGFNGSVPRCCKDGGKDFVPREFMHPECLPIAVPASDPFYGPRGVRCLDFVRSSPAPRDDCALGWREQMNQVSAYIDASPLYGSSARQSDKLRLFRNGMLQYGRVQQRRPLLPPERRDELCRGGAVSTECFKSGDGRVNEHPGLVAAHIVWLRQHNRMAQELSHLNSHWSDEKIYQETRKIVGAMVQHITYREFLPIVLGTEVMRLFDLEPLKKGFFRSYSLKTNPSPASSFGSAAFRFGHSLVQSSMVRFDRFHRPINNNVSLHDELSNPSNIWSMGAVDRLLLGMVNQPIQKRDEFITEELTNHLFQTPQFDFGMDLAAINIQRGRDHGVAPYTSWREPCGLTSITEFEDLFRVMPSRTVRKLQALYRHVDDIDLFTGGMAERPVVGGLVGPTFSCIIAQQFSNLRKGDRFWYENGGFDSSFTPAQLQQIRRVTFAQVLCRTLDNIDNVQPFVFLSANNNNNERISCLNGLLNNFDLSAWIEIDNDISKTEDIVKEPKTEKPITTTTKSLTTMKSNKKPPKGTITNSNKNNQKKPSNLPPVNSNKPLIDTNNQKLVHKLNNTDAIININNNTSLNMIDKTKLNVTIQKIDDKLDFKNNKSRRFEDVERMDDDRYVYRKKPSKQHYDYDYDNDEPHSHSQQAVVINNLSYNRPGSYHRPVIAVTENVDKFTYLINYVPRPTQSWRRSTKNPYNDRDIVKVTYQNYDDTYNRRPYRPYFSNRQEERPLETEDQLTYRHNAPDTFTTKRHDQFLSSARSNDDLTTSVPSTINKYDNNKQYVTPTTENFYKLVTFRYVGTYKGHDVLNDHDKDNTKANTKTDENTKAKRDDTDNTNISKDISTKLNDDDTNSMKLSTFYLHETATRPYGTLHRPTRRNDDEYDKLSKATISKYYYVRNVLHKYPDIDSTVTEKPIVDQHINNDFVKENYNNPGTPDHFNNYEAQERSSVDKLAFLEEVESAKSPDSEGKRDKTTRPQQSAAKTPSVAFQIIPSENSPMMWAVYEEKTDLPEGLPHVMPTVQSDPHALKEIPRPMDLTAMKDRRKPNINRRLGN